MPLINPPGSISGAACPVVVVGVTLVLVALVLVALMLGALMLVALLLAELILVALVLVPVIPLPPPYCAWAAVAAANDTASIRKNLATDSLLATGSWRYRSIAPFPCQLRGSRA
jgi:hypothetical protein